MGYVKLLFFMLFLVAFSSSLPHLCPKDEALALLQFNHMLTINNETNACFDIVTGQRIQPYPKTLSWNKSTDCCLWDGVYCDEMTGQVIELNLTCSGLQGKFHTNSTLFQLSNLKRLDLSGNNFSGSFISPKFGELSSLTHLDLSDSSFTGVIPTEISHLSKLCVLHIWSSYQYELSLRPHNFELLLKNMTQLRELNLYSVNISSTFPLNFSSYLTTLSLPFTQLYGILPERVFHLSNLESLYLRDSPQLTVRFPTTKWNSSATLMGLHLSGVNATGRIPESFGHLTSLRELGIESCNLSGSIPKPLWNLTNIEELYLDDNHLEGPISGVFRFGKLWWISLRNNNFDGQLAFLSFNRSWMQLEVLDFSSNSLTGPIPSNVSGLQNLGELSLSSNNLNGTIPSWIFSLPSLTDLDLSSNSLTGPIPSNVSGLQNLQLLYLSSNNLNGTIPSWIFSLPSLTDLDLSSNSLTGPIPSNVSGLQNPQRLYMSSNHLNGTIPSWIFSLPSLIDLDLSSNSLTGPIPSNVSGLQNLISLYLSSNHLNGTIPSWIFSLPSLRQLNLSDNQFSGTIQEFKSHTLSQVDLKQNQLQGPIPKSLLNQSELQHLLLSHNNLSGQIASTTSCNLSELWILDLGSNNLEGTIPLCLGKMSQLSILDLSNNSFSGTINTTFSIENSLQIIKFDGNKLEGKVPQSLINCRYLEVLDLGNNELSDTFPKWLGALPYLQILKLRSNEFYGSIMTDNLFAQIRVIDLSSNGFSGDLPVSLFKNFQAMKIISENNRTREYVADEFSNLYINSLIVTTKGLNHELPRVLTTQIIIDLSRNRFEGQIPSIIGDLIGLRTLNLSHNALEGDIPASLHNLSVLESLDLSSNKISGEIPQQLASLTFLEVLNLSHNHLVGCIPKGKQFDTFENSSYQGNDGLEDCGGNDRVPQATTPTELEEEEDIPMISWQAVLMGYGCGLVIGLSVIYILLSTQYPAWFSRMFEELEHRIIRRMQKHGKRN